MSNTNPKKLWVEGATDKRVIPYLMEKNGIQWPKNPPVFIKDYGGCNCLSQKLTEAEYLDTQLQGRGLTHLGIIIDADTESLRSNENQPAGRWQSLRDACLKSEYIESLPEEFPSDGLIQKISNNNIKFGIWIMPDNRNQGMLETFLAYLVPENSNQLWQFAQKTAQEAKEKHQASFKEVHRDKANIYTWLAWQDEPGRQLHEAINETIFDATHPKAQDFVNWFKSLYDL